MNKHLLGIFGLLLANSAVLAQSQTILPSSLQNEEREYLDAVKKVRQDYLNTDMLERFIKRYPSSRYLSDAILELERAQILSKGRFEYAMPVPQLYQFRPSEQPYQFLYENFNELNGDNPDYKALRKKYELLVSDFSDPAYYNEATYYLGYIDYVEGKYDDALNRFNSLTDDPKFSQTVPFYKMQILYKR